MPRAIAAHVVLAFDETGQRVIAARAGFVPGGLDWDLAALWAGQRLDFAQFAGVATGEDELFHESILPCGCVSRGCTQVTAFVTNIKLGRWRRGMLYAERAGQ